MGFLKDYFQMMGEELPALMVIFAFILSAAYIQTKIIQWSDGDVKRIRFLRTILMTYFEVILIVWIVFCCVNQLGY